MSMRLFLSAALMLLTTITFAEHAVALAAETSPEPTAARGSPQPPATTEPELVRTAAAKPATNGKLAVPAELEVYLVETGTREVCDTFNFGWGDVRTECRVESLAARAKNPALRGICITRYGNHTCY